MKILILTLSECEERRKKIGESIERYGYEYEFIFNEPNLIPPKVDPISFSPIPEITIHYDSQPTIGEWGCKLGHMLLYKTMLERGYDEALLLEDDAIWVCDVPKVIEAAKKVLPNAELISGCLWKPWWISKDAYKSVCEGHWKCEDITFYARYLGYGALNWYYNPANVIGSNACYWLKATAAKKLLAVNEKYPFPADVLIHNWMFTDIVHANTREVLVEINQMPSVIANLKDGQDRTHTSHTITATTYKQFCNGKKKWNGGVICYKPIPYSD